MDFLRKQESIQNRNIQPSSYILFQIINEVSHFKGKNYQMKKEVMNGLNSI